MPPSTRRYWPRRSAKPFSGRSGIRYRIQSTTSADGFWAQGLARENVKEFFEWALLNRGTESEDELVRRAQEDPETKIEEEAELKEYVDGMETMLGRPILPGRGPAKSLRLTIDEVNMRHRPVVWYIVSQSTNICNWRTILTLPRLSCL
jgi:hypothetical protein